MAFDENVRGGPEWTRTTEGVSQQIYSLPRLTASVPTHENQRLTKERCVRGFYAVLPAQTIR